MEISDPKRELAIAQLKRKRGFATHLVVYLAVNTALVIFWFVLSLGGPTGFFWPVFPIVGWGFGVLMHGFTTYRGDVFSEAQIRREIEKLG